MIEGDLLGTLWGKGKWRDDWLEQSQCGAEEDPALTLGEGFVDGDPLQLVQGIPLLSNWGVSLSTFASYPPPAPRVPAKIPVIHFGKKSVSRPPPRGVGSPATKQ